MIIARSAQAQERRGKTELVVSTERVDAVALLLAQLMTMGLPEVLDDHVPRHGKHQGLRWGGTAVIWLASLLNEGDQRTVAMATSGRGMRETRGQSTAQTIHVRDVRDDRWAHLRTPRAKAQDWHAIEQACNARRITRSHLPTAVMRCDATTVSAGHAVIDGGLVPVGPRTADPSRPPINIMTASLDPLGLPLATDVVAGAQADAGCSLPLLERIDTGRKKPGLLVVGACKMRALAIRAHRSARPHGSLAPCPLTGTTATQMPQGISQGIATAQADELEGVCRTNDKGPEVLVAPGDEVARTCRVKEAHGPRAWPARVLVMHAPAHGARQANGLDQRLAQAATTRRALTPARGRGKRHITEEAALLRARAPVRKAKRSAGLGAIVSGKHTERRTQYVGRGRGSATRDTRVIEPGRSHLPAVTRHADRLDDRKAPGGWQAWVTKATATRLSLADAGLCSRHAYRVARMFHRLKRRVPIAPMFVSRAEHIRGLTSLWTWGVRVVTVRAWTLRRSVQQDQVQLPGLHPENRPTCPEKPTAERVLKAFSQVTLPLSKDTAGREVGRWVTPLSSGQQDILRRLEMEASLYQQLEMRNTRN